MHWKDKALTALIRQYKVSDTTYYFPYQDMTVRFIDGVWYLGSITITREHMSEIYSTELYHEDWEDA